MPEDTQMENTLPRGLAWGAQPKAVPAQPRSSCTVSPAGPFPAGTASMARFCCCATRSTLSLQKGTGGFILQQLNNVAGQLCPQPPLFNRTEKIRKQT